MLFVLGGEALVLRFGWSSWAVQKGHGRFGCDLNPPPPPHPKFESVMAAYAYTAVL